jgi:hypothetical protein
MTGSNQCESENINKESYLLQAMQFYAQNLMISIIQVKKILTVKDWPEHDQCTFIDCEDEIHLPVDSEVVCNTTNNIINKSNHTNTNTHFLTQQIHFLAILATKVKVNGKCTESKYHFSTSTLDRTGWTVSHCSRFSTGIRNINRDDIHCNLSGNVKW